MTENPLSVAPGILDEADRVLRAHGPLVAVWGAAHRAGVTDLARAEQTAYELGRRGYGLMTGTVGGISAAANEGAARAGAPRVQLRLDGQPVNPHATTVLDVRYPWLGKMIFGRACAAVAFSGGLGTLTDVVDAWYALRQGTTHAPLILASGELRDALLGMLAGPLRRAGLFSGHELDLVRRADRVEEIVEIVTAGGDGPGPTAGDRP